MSGTLMDLSHQMSAVRAVLVDSDGQVTELYAEPRSADTAQQSVSFELDTTQFEDGAYQYDIIATYADASAGDSEIMLYETNVTIDNGGSNYLLSALEDGEPLVGAEVVIYGSDGDVVQKGITDRLGNFAVSAKTADAGGLTAMVSGEECLFLYTLEPQPRGNAYTLGGDPTSLTVTASPETLATLNDASLLLTLPDGETTEMATVTESGAAVSFCTNKPLTFTVSNSKAALTREFALHQTDCEWNLDEELAAAVTLTLDNAYAEAEGVYLSVNGNRYTLPATGGDVLVAPGHYDVSARVWKKNSYGTGIYFDVDFGSVSLAENRTLVIGDSVKAELSLEADSVVQNESQTVSYTISDSAGNTVVDVGYIHNTGTDHEYAYSYAKDNKLSFYRYQAEDDSWEEAESESVSWIEKDHIFSTSFSTSLLDNEAGAYRVHLKSYESDYEEFFNDDFQSFTVTAEETRPAARVNFTFINFEEYAESNAAFYVLLQNERGEWISRRSMTLNDRGGDRDEPPYTYLPIGETYEAAMISHCYNETLSGESAAAARFTIDLTDAEAGDTVDVTVEARYDDWVTTRFVEQMAAGAVTDESDTPIAIPGETALPEQPIAIPVDPSDVDASYTDVPIGSHVNYSVSDVTIYPFAELPEAGVRTTADTYQSLRGIAVKDIAETDIDCTLRVGGNDEVYVADAVNNSRNYRSEVTVSTRRDLSAGGSMPLGLPLKPAVIGETAEFYSGRDVRLTYQLRDLGGNSVRDITYYERMTDDYESGYDPIYLATSDLTTKAYVTLRRANGTVAGQYDLSDVYGGSVKLTGLADGSYTATATVEGSRITATGESFAFTVGGQAPSDLLKTVESPKDFAAKAQSVSEIALSWRAPDDTIEKYILYRDSMPFAELDGAATSYTDSGITADRYYTYVLYAVDSDGTMSEGAMAGSRPAAAPDTTAPSVPGGLLAKLFGSEVTLTWNRSTDNVAVTNYIITCNGAEIGRSYNRRFVQSGLMPGAQCSYTVSAIDGAGNRSAESTPVTVSVPDVSGITAASLTYDKNKAGCITGTALHINARTTADIASAQAVVELTDTDGASDSLTVSLSAGKNGLKVGTVSLPYDFMTVERVTLTAYKTGVSDPADTKELIDAAITRANAFTVTLTNTKGLELPDLMKSVTVTVTNGSGTYSASRKIADFAGHVTLFAPAAEGNTVIITSDGGDTLCTKRGVSIPAAGGSLTVDAQEAAGMVRLRLFETNGSLTDYTGVQVTARIKDRTVTGTADADGYVVWPSGHNLLVVDRDACEYDSDGTPRVTFSVAAQEVRKTDRVVSLNAASETKSLPDMVNDVRLSFGSAVLRLRTATAYVKDPKGRPVKGVTMRFSGKTTAAAVTDEEGVARAHVQVYDYGRNMTGPVVVKLDSKMATDGRRWDWGFISYAEQANDYVCRPILTQVSSLSISPVIKVMENGVAVPLDESAAADASLAMLVNETAFYPNGGRWEKRSLTFTDGEVINIRLTATLGDKMWRGKASLTFDSDAAEITPELVLYADVTAKLTLTSSNKGLLPGVQRRFIVFDADGNKLNDVKTYAPSVNVSLPRNEKLFIVATFETVGNPSLYEWKNYATNTAIQEMTVVGEDEQIDFSARYGAEISSSKFWIENGFSGTPSQYRLDNGDWQVSFSYLNP